ncbi:hypothetical protein E3N88_18234 [Mikania micrantha]|uniref:Uncharacterized protein n=1 Tax=Mikania micrantha TaxID=192012 RepID=A0A5N6NWU5_9ASTR|nr:hypothetical protein E3N88_18234 [Mikania micrantha]
MLVCPIWHNQVREWAGPLEPPALPPYSPPAEFPYVEQPSRDVDSMREMVNTGENHARNGVPDCPESQNEENYKNVKVKGSRRNVSRRSGNKGKRASESSAVDRAKKTKNLALGGTPQATTWSQAVRLGTFSDSIESTRTA